MFFRAGHCVFPDLSPVFLFMDMSPDFLAIDSLDTHSSNKIDDSKCWYLLELRL